MITSVVDCYTLFIDNDKFKLCWAVFDNAGTNSDETWGNSC